MSSCAEMAVGSKDKPLPEIRVNGVLLDESLYAQELQYHHARDFESAQQKAGQALVIRQLLIDELETDFAGDEPIDDEEEAIQALLEKNVSSQEVSEEDCRHYFENNPDRFKGRPLLEVDHILLAAPQDDFSERDQVKQKALSIIEQLRADPALFPALAEEFSICPSKKTGGSLGQIGKGQTVPEFEKQIMRLPVGLAKAPIESRYGFHVVRLKNRIEGKPVEYDMVTEKIKSYLSQRASRLSIQSYIQSLVEKADIEGIQIGFSDENIVA
jgi:peptidyl-prolyl cis-trans isomerase C